MRDGASLGNGLGGSIGIAGRWTLLGAGSGFGFFSGRGGGGSISGAGSSRTDITGIGGGSSRARRKDQSTPNKRTGTSSSTANAISVAFHSGSASLSSSCGCAHSAPLRARPVAVIACGRRISSALLGPCRDPHRRDSGRAYAVHHLEQSLQRRVLVTREHHLDRFVALERRKFVLQRLRRNRLAVQNDL